MRKEVLAMENVMTNNTLVELTPEEEKLFIRV